MCSTRVLFRQVLGVTDAEIDDLSTLCFGSSNFHTIDVAGFYCVPVVITGYHTLARTHLGVMLGLPSLHSASCLR